MKKRTFYFSFFAVFVLLTGCASTVSIRSFPGDAKIYIDDSFKGQTPYVHSDSKFAGSSTRITLKKEGYETKNVVLTKNAKLNIGALIGGIFLIFPFIWIMDYENEVNLEMDPAQSNARASLK